MYSKKYRIRFAFKLTRNWHRIYPMQKQPFHNTVLNEKNYGFCSWVKTQKHLKMDLISGTIRPKIISRKQKAKIPKPILKYCMEHGTGRKPKSKRRTPYGLSNIVYLCSIAILFRTFCIFFTPRCFTSEHIGTALNFEWPCIIIGRLLSALLHTA